MASEQDRLDVRVGFKSFHLRRGICAVQQNINIFAELSGSGKHVGNVLVERALELVSEHKRGELGRSSGERGELCTEGELVREKRRE